MSMTNYLEDVLLNHVFRNTPYTPPTTIYFALFTTPTDDTGAGTEVVGGSYARQAVTFAAPVSGDGTVQNDASVTYTNLPNITVVAVAFMDNLIAGNMLVHKNLGAPKTYGAGDNVTIAIGDLMAQFG